MNLSGLTSKQVKVKKEQGRINRVPGKNTNSIGKIILKNTLTIFNLVNIILAILIISVGAYKNLLFVLIAIANTLISIINEIRAKKTVDKMRLIAEKQPTVIREGKNIQIKQSEIVDGDLIVYGFGDQVVVDAQIEQGSVEVNESFITGEQDNVLKKPGDKLISGSFIVSGTCKATVTAVGAENFINKLESSAHTIKTADSKLFTIMNNIVKYISIILIPIGVLLLWARFRVPDTTPEVAVTSTVASLINMIPEGLILLTSSVLALATIRLSRQKVLVQDLYSIETLARIDCIALDKTGTLTTGRMTVKDIIPAEGHTKNALEKALKLILSATATDNATSTALKEKLLKKAKFKPTEQIIEFIPFSSDRKYSGVRTKDATYLMGAPEIIAGNTPDFPGTFRILAVVKDEHQKGGLEESVGGYDRDRRSASPVTTGERDSVSDKPPFDVLGYILLEDELRKDAEEIINYFYKNDVDIKIISGDNLKTVETIAKNTGIKNISGIDLSTIKGDINYEKLVKNYNIFTRVKPAQKKSLILTLKKLGKTVAMTGDGVNDILAMKEADCSIAIGEGSDAARRSAKLVLLSNDFAGVPKIIAEGRQTINNLERSTTLFIAKTVYASILAVVFIFLPFRSPFASPVEMSLLNFACIGFPGLILALEHNTSRIKNLFVKNILQYSVPVGLTISIAMIVLSCLTHNNFFPVHELSTIAIFVTFIVDLALIYRISRPLTPLRSALLITIIGIIVAAFVIPFLHDFFDFIYLGRNGIIILAVTAVLSLVIFEVIHHLVRYFSLRFDKKSY
ncbi:HAD-IC family P-type ATPase [Candidatus Saccharibacteria bacterium]|nr:HAD-IC family P-type ATPase [Candidatus Saccharibacteria bacterium]